MLVNVVTIYIVLISLKKIYHGYRMPVIWVYGNHYDIWELLTSIAYASENLKTFVDLSWFSDRRSSLAAVYAVT